MAYLIFESSKVFKQRPSWRVKNKKQDILGYIKWDRKYFVFVPHFAILYESELSGCTEYSYPVFSHDCLDEISHFLKRVEHLGVKHDAKKTN